MNNETERPSVHTIIYWLLLDKKIDSSQLYNFMEIYWPTFVVQDGYVFVKESFSQNRYSELLKKNERLEFWINLFLISPYFEDKDDGYEESLDFADKLVEIWKVKLQLEFPNHEFTVEKVYDEENGDCGITFYQRHVQNTVA